MKVLHINYSDWGGGAAIAAYRHHEAMRRAGIDSKMLVVEKKTSDSSVIQTEVSQRKLFIARLVNRFFMKTCRPYASWSYNHFGYDLSKNKEVKEADIIILHWINQYTLSIRSLEKILKTGKTVYWFMHDSWPITGGCHHPLECEFFKSHCRECPMFHMKTGSRKERDLSFRQFNEKLQRLSPYRNLHFLTPSQWLANMVKKSALFGKHDVKVVRNVIDTNVFKPRDKKLARERLGLPIDKKLILFGADNLKSSYKGWPLLRDALNMPMRGIEAVVYGLVPDDIQSRLSIKIHSLGRISELEKLLDLYSSCDIFITTSVADNYPNVLIEAMACGLPCIGTNVGGIPEIISDAKTGTVIMDSTPNTMREAIVALIGNEQLYDTMSKKSINQIMRTNSYECGVWDFVNSDCNSD